MRSFFLFLLVLGTPVDVRADVDVAHGLEGEVPEGVGRGGAGGAGGAGSPVVIKPSDTFEGFVREMGFPVENHTAVTADGVELRLFRLPQPAAATPAPAVLLQHGILASCWCWVAHGDPARAVAFALHRAGYDVWLSNSRGNTFSHNSTNPAVPVRSDAFWNFTFETMGDLDVHTNVDYVLGATGRKDLSFVGWSQGHTQFMMAALTQPALRRKINLYAGISPVVYLTHATSTFLTTIAKLGLGGALYAVYKRQFLGGAPAVHAAEELLCKLTLGAVCELSVDVFCGSSPLDDSKLIENVAAHFPAGTSVKDFVHYVQYIKAGHFARFDYGRRGNPLQYNGSAAPPLYDLSAFPAPPNASSGGSGADGGVPLALFSGDDDALVANEDRERQLRELNASASSGGASPVVFNRVYAGFSHLTWFVGKETAYPWLDDLLGVLQQYNKPQPRSGADAAAITM